MTVKELKEKLKAVPDTAVVFREDNGGETMVRKVIVIGETSGGRTPVVIFE